MKKILVTNPKNYLALIARLALAIVLFPHGAQKLFGWFGGFGFTGTMGFLTGQAHLPYVLALLVIFIEFLGSLLLLTGFLSRIAAATIIIEFLGVVFTHHIQNGFFMNWGGTQKGEGFEYFILLFGLAIIVLIAGGGAASIDASISKNSPANATRSTAF